MPQVPGLFPTASPSVDAAPEVSLPVPLDAFGGGVAKAFEGLGGAIEKSGDVIWQRAMEMQHLKNETDAKDADAKYMVQSGMMHQDFLNKEGNNASPEALGKHIQDLQDLRVNLRQGLNPMAASMYDSSSLSFMGRNIFNAAGHSGQQMKIASNNAATSRKDIIKNSIDLDPTDEVAFQRGTSAIKGENERLAQNGGWSPEQKQATDENDLSDYWGKRIVAVSNAKQGALGAQQMLNTAIKNKAITPLDAQKVQNTIDRKIDDQGARSITDKVMAPYRDGDETKTEQQYIDDGLKEVQAVKGLTDDQRQSLADRTRTNVSIAFRQQKSVIRQQQSDDYQTVTKALDTPDSSGRLPWSMDQLKMNPEVGPVLDRMRPTQIRSIGNRLLTNAMGKAVIPTPENQDRYHTLLGMAHDDPESFMSTPIYSENIPKFQRDQLVQIQAKGARQAANDPRVTHAMSYLNQTGVLKSAGIDKKIDSEEYYNFVGALQDGIAARQHETQKKVSDEEIQQISNRLLQEKGISKGWLWDSSTALYKTSVPEEDEARIKNDPYWKQSQQQPSAQQIHNYYVREQYNKLFKGSAGTSKNAIVPGTVSAPRSE